MKHIQMGESILGDADNPELPYDKEELLKRYESEDIIVLLNADINLINSVCADLGATPEDESILGNHDRLDAYAVARVNTFGLISNFSYIVPKMDDPESDDIVLTSDDVSVIENVDEEEAVSDDQTPELGQPDSSDVLPEELSPYELQVRRWVSFLQWMGNIAAEALRDQATAAIFAAEAAQHDQLTLITSAQTKDWAQTFNYTMGLKSYGGGSYTAVRTNTVKYKIYTAHSFTNGKDYYLVHCEASTNPDTWFDSYVDDGKWKHNFTQRSSALSKLLTAAGWVLVMSHCMTVLPRTSTRQRPTPTARRGMLAANLVSARTEYLLKWAEASPTQRTYLGRLRNTR